MSYTPQPGSQSAKVLAVLQAMPGTEMTCAEIAGDVGCPSSSVHGLLSSAVRSGAARKLLREGRVYFVADKPAPPPVEAPPAPPAAAQPVERDDAPIVQRVVPAAGAKALDLQRHPLDAAWHRVASAKETPQEGANRDASAGQSHDAEGSASPAGRGTNGASARGAAPVFLPGVVLPKPATSPKSHPKHGYSQTPEYRAWQCMVKRCTDPENAAWTDYGGRGITVCDRWRTDVVAFIEDMGAKPSELHELDRKDNDGGYEPGNCRWVLRTENNRNRRSNRIVEWNGQKKTLIEWCEITGLPFSTLKWRLDNGWSVDRAMTEAAMPDATDRGAPDIASPRVGAMGAGQAADAAPAVVHGFVQPESTAGKLRIALWNDGALQIYRQGGGLNVLLNPDETRALVAYLERLAA